MSRFSAAILAFLIFGFCANAQWYRDRISENPERAAGVYHYYEYAAAASTPAPKGYKPFYISHYGRHGSRYHQQTSTFDGAVRIMDEARSKGMLTDEGLLLSRQLDTVLSEHQDMCGMLSERGMAEQEGLGARMAKNFGRVFKGRSEVDCASSYYPRCIMSMACFTQSLQKSSDADNMKIHYQTGPKYYNYLSMDVWSEDYSAKCDALVNHLIDSLINPERFFRNIFKDPSAGKALAKDPRDFIRQVYFAGSISPNLESRPDIFSHFTVDELVACWIPSNCSMYYVYGISAEAGDFYSGIARPLLMDFVAKADAALASGSDRAADLRFGHDTGLLPFIGTIGLKYYGDAAGIPSSEGLHQRWASASVQNHFATFDMISMASNLQMIFYKNRRNDVIVKLLYNEKEACLPAVKAFDGPYYRWSDLREYFQDLIARLPISKMTSFDDGEVTGVDTKAVNASNPY